MNLDPYYFAALDAAYNRGEVGVEVADDHEPAPPHDELRCPDHGFISCDCPLWGDGENPYNAGWARS